MKKRNDKKILMISAMRMVSPAINHSKKWGFPGMGIAPVVLTAVPAGFGLSEKTKNR